MIDIRDLAFSYPKSNFRLHINSLTADPKSTVAIVGPSGSGKTTLLNLIAGVLAPESGSILVEGNDVAAMSDRQRREFRLQNVGMVFQNFELVDYLNVVDNVLLPYRIGNLSPSKADRVRATELLDQCGLSQHVRKPVTQLSQGECQRVAICRALLAKPSLVLADEPTGNLDPDTSGHVLQLLMDAVSATDATLMLVTHDHSLLENFDAVVDFSRFLVPVN